MVGECKKKTGSSSKDDNFFLHCSDPTTLPKRFVSQPLRSIFTQHISEVFFEIAVIQLLVPGAKVSIPFNHEVLIHWIPERSCIMISCEVHNWPAPSPFVRRCSSLSKHISIVCTSSRLSVQASVSMGLTGTQRVLLMQIHAFISFEIRPQLESGEYPLDSRPLVLFSAPLTVVSCRGGFCIRRPRRRWRHGQAFWMSDMPNSCPNTETPLTYPELLEQISSTSKLRAKIGI